jgi:hypothetical protein
MRKLGKVVFMGEAEYWTTLRRTSDDDDKMFTAGNNAGKFHSAGGYSHTLPKLKEQLANATALLERWRPLVEALETHKGQYTEVP